MLTGTASPGSAVAQGDPVGPGDAASLDGSQSFTQAFAGLPQKLQRVGGRVLRSGPIRISRMLFDEVCLKCRSDLIGRLQRVIDGPVPCGVVNHAASISRTLRRLHYGPAPTGTCLYAALSKPCRGPQACTAAGAIAPVWWSSRRVPNPFGG